MRKVKKIRSTRCAVLLVVPLLTATLAAPPSATAQEARWTLRAAAARVAPSGGELAAELPGGERFRFSAEDGIGLAVELEYRLRPRLGLEIAALTADLDAEFSIAPGGATLTDTEQAIFELYSAGVNYHLTPGRHLDLHVGAFAAITYFDDVIFLTEAGRSDKLVFDDDVGFGLKLGLDRPLGAAGRWQVSAGLRYLSAILEGEAAGQDADLDPLILTVGIGYRL